MSGKIRIGIVGYGNLGKGAVKAIQQTEDMELVAVFTRRDPASLKLEDSNVETVHIDDASKYKDKIDYFWEQHQKSQGGHYEDNWQSEYERLHHKLMNSAYSRYNYASKPPYSFPKSINWDWDY